jgi:hypothetical protein
MVDSPVHVIQETARAGVRIRDSERPEPISIDGVPNPTPITQPIKFYLCDPAHAAEVGEIQGEDPVIKAIGIHCNIAAPYAISAHAEIA